MHGCSIFLPKATMYPGGPSGQKTVAGMTPLAESKLDSSDSSLTQKYIKNLASRGTRLLGFLDDTNLCQKLPLTHVGDCKI